MFEDSQRQKQRIYSRRDGSVQRYWLIFSALHSTMNLDYIWERPAFLAALLLLSREMAGHDPNMVNWALNQSNKQFKRQKATLKLRNSN